MHGQNHIKSKWNFNESVWRTWTRLICLRIGKSVGLFGVFCTVCFWTVLKMFRKNLLRPSSRSE